METDEKQESRILISEEDPAFSLSAASTMTGRKKVAELLADFRHEVLDRYDGRDVSVMRIRFGLFLRDAHANLSRDVCVMPRAGNPGLLAPF